MNGAPRAGRFLRGLPAALVLLACACIPIPVPARVTLEGELPAVLPLEKGEVLVVVGEDPTIPKDPTAPYFTGGSLLCFMPDAVGAVARTLLKVNPEPGRFAVIPRDDVASDAPPTLAPDDPIFVRAGISAEKAASARVRYVVYVKEVVDATLWVPLYIVPFGVAVTTSSSVLEATVFEAATERFVGTLKATSKGQFVLVAYLLHVLVYTDTQKDARDRIATEIVKRLTGPRH